MAIIRALDTAPKDRDVAIVTDSEYSINCATKWAEGWRRNGWKTTSGKAVENKDLVEAILTRVEERTALGSQTVFEWIKGHANHLGNVEADKLAVNAAKVAANVSSGYM
jgi:ribonuclease HI